MTVYVLPPGHRELGYSWDDVVNDPDRKMGHGFALAIMIEGVL